MITNHFAIKAKYIGCSMTNINDAGRFSLSHGMYRYVVPSDDKRFPGFLSLDRQFFIHSDDLIFEESLPQDGTVVASPKPSARALMSGICSRHQDHDPDCDLCNTTPAELLGVTQEHWDSKVAEAQAAGEHKCTGCDFVFYLTVTSCPQCGKEIL